MVVLNTLVSMATTGHLVQLMSIFGIASTSFYIRQVSTRPIMPMVTDSGVILSAA